MTPPFRRKIGRGDFAGPRSDRGLQLSEPNSAASRDRHDDLAERVASRQPGDRGARFAKRETLGYARPDRAFLVEREKLLGVARVALGIARREGAPEHADDLTGFQQREIERQFWNAGGKADDQETPLPADRA